MTELDAYMTPTWAAQRLIEAYFSHLGAGDRVLEPSCGCGAFLAAIPQEVDAIGVEIDPGRALLAAHVSGRQVLTGDIRDVELPWAPTAVVGNPPFQVKLIEQILARAHVWLPDGGLVGLVLPAYMFQTSQRVVGYSRQWGIKADHLPRDLFPGLSKPLVFASFVRGGRLLQGFTLYEEVADVKTMPVAMQSVLRRGGNPVWREAVALGIVEAGGEASLQELYTRLEPKRPTGNPWWKEKIRQTCQKYFNKTSRGRYALV